MVSENDCRKIEKLPLAVIVKENIDKENNLKISRNAAMFNATIKVLYDHKTYVGQDDYTGNYGIETNPQVKSILKN